MKSIILAEDLAKIRKLEELYEGFSSESLRLLEQEDVCYRIYLQLADFVKKERDLLFHEVDDDALKLLIGNVGEQKKDSVKLHIA